MNDDKMNLGSPIFLTVIALVLGTIAQITWAVPFWAMVLYIACGTLIGSAYDRFSMEWTLKKFHKEMEKSFEDLQPPSNCDGCGGGNCSAH
jgi:hypothetical protein